MLLVSRFPVRTTVLGSATRLLNVRTLVAVMATGGSLASIGQTFEADASSVKAFLTLPTLLSQALSAGMITIYYVIVLSPSAIAYLGLSGHAQPAPADGWA